MENAYEAERARTIAANQARMVQLGLVEASVDLAASSRALARTKAPKRKRTGNYVARIKVPSLPSRRSGLNGKPAVLYSDDILDAADRGNRAKGRVGSGAGTISIPAGPREEVYSMQHVAMLHGCQTPWELFQDGYDANGDRVYDKIGGLTCHQCRQKTAGKRTVCSCCNSLNGVFCGDCLFMRYGEHVDEALATPGWMCPHCRDPRLCNCSIHRTRYGWAPTGSLYRKVIGLGYKSAAHYLVLTNLSPEAATIIAAEEAAAAGTITTAAAPAAEAEVPVVVALQESVPQESEVATVMVRGAGRKPAAAAAAAVGATRRLTHTRSVTLRTTSKPAANAKSTSVAKGNAIKATFKAVKLVQK